MYRWNSADAYVVRKALHVRRSRAASPTEPQLCSTRSRSSASAPAAVNVAVKDSSVGRGRSGAPARAPCVAAGRKVFWLSLVNARAS